MTSDPFRLLGLDSTASRRDVLRARRRLALAQHPDRGGDSETMAAINAAAQAALAAVAAGRVAPPNRSANQRGSDASASQMQTDAPSLVIDELPAVAYEAVLLAIAALGDPVEQDPPYRLVADLADPFRGWCEVTLVPEAGSSTVSLSVASRPGSPIPSVDHVRAALIAELNALDWEELLQP